MRILSISHVLRDVAGGAASATMLMNHAIRRRHHEVIEIFADDLLASPVGRRAREVLPLMVMWHVTKFADEFDVVEVTGHAGWSAFPLLRARRWSRRRKPLLVARSYGLEHFDHKVRLEEMRSGRITLSAGYRVGGGFVTLREVELAIAASDLFAASRPRAATWAVRRRLKVPQACVVAGFGVTEEALQYEPQVRQSLRVAWVGTTVERKGWQDFVAGFTLASRVNCGIGAAIVGTGRSSSEVAQAFPIDVRDRILVYPRLTEEELFEVLGGSGCFVSASLSEGYHLAALQAMALGVPVISTPEGFLADIDRACGDTIYRQIPKRSPPDLAEAILSVITPLDSSAEAEVRNMSKRARGFARAHSWDDVAETTINAYERSRERLLAGSKPSS